MLAGEDSSTLDPAFHGCNSLLNNLVLGLSIGLFFFRVVILLRLLGCVFEFPEW